MSVDEFLAWEAKQGPRYEFDGFAPVAMAGGTREHAAIAANLITALRTRLRGKACQAFGSDLKVEVAGAVRYPDAFVACTPLPRGTAVVRDPVVIFEVLSESTGATDRILKNREYRATPSVRHYVILEQTRVGATIFTRNGDIWISRVAGEGDVLELPEIEISLPLDECYMDVALEDEPAE